MTSVFQRAGPRAAARRARRLRGGRSTRRKGASWRKPCCRAASSPGLEPLLVVINSQEFTKTANCWGVRNNPKGTNTNRIVVFRKP